MVNTNENFAKLEQLLQAMGKQATAMPQAHADYQRFIEKFPAEQLTALSLDQYCVGKQSRDSFCWWLERGLEGVLGRYMPGTSRGHILYFLKDGSLYKHRHLQELSDADALQYVLRVHAALALANPEEGLSWVDDDAQIYQRAGVQPRVTMGDGRKLRMLAAFHPDAVLPISSSDHVAHFLKVLGCQPADVPAANQPVARMLLLRRYYEQAAQSCQGLTPLGFVHGLYADGLGLAPLRDVDDVLRHFAALPGLAEGLRAHGQLDAFCQLAMALHESGLDWWVTQAKLIHSGRTDDPKVWQTTVALELELRSDGLWVLLGDAGWHKLDADVAAKAIDAAQVGDRIPALAGRSACWPDDYDGSDTSLTVLLKDGAVRNGYIRVPKLQALFPAACIAPNEKTPAAQQFSLALPNGETISTAVLANRGRIQARFGALFAQSGLKEGDRAFITKEGENACRLSFSETRPASPSVQPSDIFSSQSEPKEEPMNTVPLNQILFGPPGTGKTYSTVTKALEILDPQLLAQVNADAALGLAEKRARLKQRFDALHGAGRIQFTTFHQSFSYEDFVEGIRAVSDDETKQLSYPVVDGVFKSLCEVAAVTTIQPVATPIELGQRQVWKMSLGNTLGDDAGIYEECVQGGYVLLGYGGDIDFSGIKNKQDVLTKYQQVDASVADGDYSVTSVATFILKMKVGDLVVVSDGNYKFRAIGEITSDYEYAGLHEVHDDGYAQRRQVRWLRQYSPSLPCSELLEKSFSQMTLYALKAPNLVRAKLQRLLGTEPAVADDFPFYVGQTIGTGYKVLRISDDLVVLSKPRDTEKVLELPRRPIEALIAYVRQGKLTVEDIRQKRVFDIVPDAPLEKFLVNGYENVLAAMAQWALQPTPVPAASQSTDARVLVIDEINRGNVSRIFGELITMLEPSKRAGASEALSVTLPYSKSKFSVPNNVYIIGTMNTTDRSLAGLDVALRRRFVFEELMPDPEALQGIEVEDSEVSVDIAALLQVMNERIEALLDREHQLGHAYFMPLRESNTLEKLAQIFKNQILPLLQEYFFDDWERIAWVLNDHRKPEVQRFVQKHGKSLETLFGDNHDVQAVSKRWRINPDAFGSLASFAGVISVSEQGAAQVGDAN